MTTVILTIKVEWDETQVYCQNDYVFFKNGNNVIMINKSDWNVVKKFIDQEIEKNG